MLGKNYITIGDVMIPNPVRFAIDSENIETVNESEAGTRLINVKRLNRRTWNLTANVSSYWREKLEALCLTEQTTLVIKEGNPIDITARLVSSELSPNSEKAQNTDGFWVLNIVLTEI